jgi:hypothetical protein
LPSLKRNVFASSSPPKYFCFVLLTLFFVVWCFQIAITLFAANRH